jgi:FimV-like protein
MSIAATMDLLYATNPDAFLDGDSTKLQKGYLLSFTPPAVQSAALNETAESIDTSTVIPRVDSLASPDSAESVMVDSTQTKFDSELRNKETAVTPEPVKLTPELNPQLTPELTPEPTPKTELTGQSTAQLQSQLQTQAQSQRKSDQGRQPETENPLLVEPVEVEPLEIEPGDGFESQIDGAEQPAPALRNQQPLESALHSTTGPSTQYSAEASESQNATALLPNDPVESKPPSIVELAQLKAVLDDFRRNPPYTAMLAALLALIFITLGVRRLGKPLASSNHTNKSDQSSAQSTPSSADNSQQSTDGVSHTENTDNLVDSVLSGPFAADSDDASGIFADTESFGDAVDNFAENAAGNKPTNLNNPEGEMDLPGQKELEAQMGDKFSELQADDLVTADDAEHLNYIDPLKVKLDMATLCAEMGDQQTAREILEEIISEADEAGRAQAQAILDQLDD